MFDAFNLSQPTQKIDNQPINDNAVQQINNEEDASFNEAEQQAEHEALKKMFNNVSQEEQDICKQEKKLSEGESANESCYCSLVESGRRCAPILAKNVLIFNTQQCGPVCGCNRSVTYY